MPDLSPLLQAFYLFLCVCVCVCFGVIRNHLAIALFFFRRIFTQISFCCRFSLLCECCWISFVGCIVFIPHK
jgi:hypothetical protein